MPYLMLILTLAVMLTLLTLTVTVSGNPNPTIPTNPRTRSLKVRVTWSRGLSRSITKNLGFFAAVTDGFRSSVCEAIFTYQVAVFKRRCVTVIVLSAAVVVGKSEGGQFLGDVWQFDSFHSLQAKWWAAGGTTLLTSYRQGICLRCMVRNKPNRR